ncbi:MAG: shikimate kinase [Bacillota bacterium]
MKDSSNIILIGFMGTGKTAVGKRLASILNMEFFDTDQEIEKVTGMSIARLFQKHGEIRFRSEEAIMIKKLSEKRNTIIATGGGIVLNTENIEILRDTGYIICLTAKPDVIYERVKRRNNRPLLKKGDTYANILTLLEEREEFYKCADFSVDTSEMDFEEIISEILKFITEKRKNKKINNQ